MTEYLLKSLNSFVEMPIDETLSLNKREQFSLEYLFSKPWQGAFYFT